MELVIEKMKAKTISECPSFLGNTSCGKISSDGFKRLSGIQEKWKKRISWNVLEFNFYKIILGKRWWQHCFSVLDLAALSRQIREEENFYFSGNCNSLGQELMKVGPGQWKVRLSEDAAESWFKHLLTVLCYRRHNRDFTWSGKPTS